MRKGAGISALSRHTATTTSYSTLSSSLLSNQITTLQSSLEAFRAALIAFSSEHRDDIRRDPAFRYQFQKMCAAIGVDPLSSGSGSGSGSGKGKAAGGGWWGDLLGLGEWEYDLAVQVVDVCVSSRAENGGMIEMAELIRRVERLRRGQIGRSASASVSGTAVAPTGTTTSAAGAAGYAVHERAEESGIAPEDILRALDLLRPLQAGYTTYTYIRTIPRELDTDQSTLLALAAISHGLLTAGNVRRQTGWKDVRVRTALEDCVLREGMGWVDAQDDAGGVGAGGFEVVWIIAAVEFGAA